MTPWALLAGGLAAVAGAVLAGPTPRRLLAQRLRVPAPAGRPGSIRDLVGRLGARPGPARPGTGAEVRPVAGAIVGTVLGVGAVAALTWVLGIAVIGVTVVATVAVGVGIRARRARIAQTRQDARRRAVMELCDAMSAELLAGKPPRHALVLVARLRPEMAELVNPAVSACRTDGDVATALRAVEAPGAEGLTRIAAAWEVADDSGAALAEVLDRVSRTLRDEQELRREVAAELAAPRATARLLAVLPVFGLALGVGTGTDPLGVLLGTPYGLACLITGIGLAVAGLAWVERLARRAEAM